MGGRYLQSLAVLRRHGQCVEQQRKANGAGHSVQRCIGCLTHCLHQSSAPPSHSPSLSRDSLLLKRHSRTASTRVLRHPSHSPSLSRDSLLLKRHSRTASARVLRHPHTPWHCIHEDTPVLHPRLLLQPYGLVLDVIFLPSLLVIRHSRTASTRVLRHPHCLVLKRHSRIASTRVM
jgi:hypothetical protein